MLKQKIQNIINVNKQQKLVSSHAIEPLQNYISKQEHTPQENSQLLLHLVSNIRDFRELTDAHDDFNDVQQILWTLSPKKQTTTVSRRGDQIPISDPGTEQAASRLPVRGKHDWRTDPYGPKVSSPEKTDPYRYMQSSNEPTDIGNLPNEPTIPGSRVKPIPPGQETQTSIRRR